MSALGVVIQIPWNILKIPALIHESQGLSDRTASLTEQLGKQHSPHLHFHSTAHCSATAKHKPAFRFSFSWFIQDNLIFPLQLHDHMLPPVDGCVFVQMQRSCLSPPCSMCHTCPMSQFDMPLTLMLQKEALEGHRSKGRATVSISHDKKFLEKALPYAY